MINNACGKNTRVRDLVKENIMIKRIYTERLASNAAVAADIAETLGITADVRVFIRYDVQEIGRAHV